MQRLQPPLAAGVTALSLGRRSFPVPVIAPKSIAASFGPSLGPTGPAHYCLPRLPAHATSADAAVRPVVTASAPSPASSASEPPREPPTAAAPPPVAAVPTTSRRGEEPTLILPGQPLPADPDVWANAVLLVDKPQGWTSFDVVAKLRGVVRVGKVGHAGTLDPMATGLLVVCCGRATKRVDDYMAREKRYTGMLRLGQGTPSYDAETAVSEEREWRHVTDDALEKARLKFIGEIEQIPPMFSALKVGGKKLCDVARKGQTLERAARSVTVRQLSLAREPGQPQDVRFEVVCSKGTYVRTLAHDLGIALGTVAHLTALRRTANGEQRVEDAWPLEQLVARVQALELPRQGKAPQQRGQRRGGGGKRRRAESGEAAVAGIE